MSTNIDYSAVAHETIYQRITGGPGSIDLREASRGWESVAAKLRDLHGTVEQAIRGIGAAQQGAAADAATQATMALMPWLEDNARMADAMAGRISHQADNFGHTHGNMPPPVEVPEVSFSQDPLKWMGERAVEWLPGIQTEHEGAKVAAQQAELRAQELMTSYQNASNFNLAIGQDFGTAPVVVADVSDPHLGGAGVGGASAGASAIPGAPFSGSAPAAGTYSAPAVAGHAASAAPAGTAPQIASGIHQAPAAAHSPQLAGGHPGPDGQPVTGSGQGRASAAAAFGPSPILPGSASGSANSGYRPRGGLGASGAGVGRGGGFGPRPSAVLGEAHSSTSGGGQAGAGHAGAGRAVRGGGALGAGVPLGATGSSGRDSDAEHQRPSYLIEPDTNAIVGDLPQVAPPVIGED